LELALHLPLMEFGDEGGDGRASSRNGVSLDVHAMPLSSVPRTLSA
jgi:hypothetical protein